MEGLKLQSVLVSQCQLLDSSQGFPRHTELQGLHAVSCRWVLQTESQERNCSDGCCCFTPETSPSYHRPPGALGSFYPAITKQKALIPIPSIQGKIWDCIFPCSGACRQAGEAMQGMDRAAFYQAAFYVAAFYVAAFISHIVSSG